MNVTVVWKTNIGRQDWHYYNVLAVHEEDNRLVLVFSSYTLRLFTFQMLEWKRDNAENDTGQPPLP